MAEIIPAIIGKTFEEVKEKIEKVKEYTTWVQFDIVDGIFAEPESWRKPLDLWEPLELPQKMELHMMVANPEKVIGDWLNSPIDRYLIHLESEGNKHTALDKIKEKGAESGMVLNLVTDIGGLAEFMDKIVLVQLMSIGTIGSYGATFQDKVFDKIKSLRKMYPDVKISVDGGVNMDNAIKLVDAGVDNLVVGSAIFKSDNIKNSIENFRKSI